MNNMLTLIVWHKEFGKSYKEHWADGSRLPQHYNKYWKIDEVIQQRIRYPAFAYEEYKDCPSWVKNLLDKEYE